MPEAPRDTIMRRFFRLPLVRMLLKFWFIASFTGCLAFTSLATRVVHLLLFLSKRRREGLSRQLASIGFKAIFLLNPHLAVEHAGEDEPAWDELFGEEQEGRVPVVLINHTSPLDSIFFAACIPTSKIERMGTLAKASLFKLPIFGAIMRACGHFPVFFQKETKENDFSVDRAAQEKVMEDLRSHIAQGGGLALFPEGQINRAGSSKQLQVFRKGALNVAKTHRMKLFAFIHTGIDVAWSPSATIGGDPAVIRFRLCRIPDPPESYDPVEFVTHCQKIMQIELDLLHALDEGKSPGEVKTLREHLTREFHEAAKSNAALETDMKKALDITSSQ